MPSPSRSVPAPGTNAARHGRLNRVVRSFRRPPPLSPRPCAAAAIVFFQNRDDLAEFRSRRIVDGAAWTCLDAGIRRRSGPLRASAVPGGVHFLISRLLRDKASSSTPQACLAGSARIRRRSSSSADPTTTRPPCRRRARRVAPRGHADTDRPGRRRRRALHDLRAVLPRGTSKVMLEAMATGRAIVTTDAIGCREPIEPEANGLLVPVASVEPLAAAIAPCRRSSPRGPHRRPASRRIAEARFDARGVDATILAALGL
ncbi:MAG: glycosyltransferase [Phycisphaerales bacterium]